MPVTAQVIQLAKHRRKKGSRGGGDDEVGRAIAKGLSKREIRKLMQRFESPLDERSMRNRALLNVWLDCGLRTSEILRLSFDHCFESDDGDFVFRVQVKGAVPDKKRYHHVALTHESIGFVRAYHEYSGIQSPLFFHTLPLRRLGFERTVLKRRGLYDIVRSWKAFTRGKRSATPHSFRHSVGKLVSDAFGHATAAQVLGHTNIRTTRTYYTDPHVGIRIAGNWRDAVVDHADQSDSTIVE